MTDKSCRTCNGRGFTIVVIPGKGTRHRNCPVCHGAGAYDESTPPIDQMRKGQIAITKDERDYWRRQYQIVKDQLEAVEALSNERGRQINELRKQIGPAISPTCCACDKRIVGEAIQHAYCTEGAD